VGVNIHPVSTKRATSIKYVQRKEALCEVSSMGCGKENVEILLLDPLNV
jgi:hypothetical protein